MSTTSNVTFQAIPRRRVTLAPTNGLLRALDGFARDPLGTVPRYVALVAIMIALPIFAEHLPLILNHFRGQ